MAEYIRFIVRGDQARGDQVRGDQGRGDQVRIEIEVPFQT